MHAFVSINLFRYHYYSATVIFHLSSAFKDITKFMDSHFLNLYIDCLCYNFKNSSTLKHLGHFYFLCILHKTYFLLEELACYFKLITLNDFKVGHPFFIENCTVTLKLHIHILWYLSPPWWIVCSFSFLKVKKMQSRCTIIFTI